MDFRLLTCFLEGFTVADNSSTNTQTVLNNGSLDKEYLGHHELQEGLVDEVASYCEEVEGLLQRAERITDNLRKERELRKETESARDAEHARNHRALIEKLNAAKQKLVNMREKLRVLVTEEK